MRVTDSRREFAALLDAESSSDLGFRRDDFHLLDDSSRRERHVAYFAGNSLGLMTKGTVERMQEDLAAWQTLGVRGHVQGERPFIAYPELFSEPMAHVVGAIPNEIVAMNGLTVNLHLLLTSFFRPSGQRTKILMEDHAFCSDSYAIRSHVASRGLNADENIIRLKPRLGEHVLRTADIAETINKHGCEISTALLGGVNYLTGEFLDIAEITGIGKASGISMGWDLAHAVGNVPLRLHDWGVDFAAWCTYKYLNSGPGSVAGAFIHERHLSRRDLPRLEGWWGNSPSTRFEMKPEIDSPLTASAWSLSCSSVYSMSSALTAIEFIDSVGMEHIRNRSLRLSTYLIGLLDLVSPRIGISLITPRDESKRGTQVSVQVPVAAKHLSEKLFEDYGVLADDRPPNIIRLAPVALYCTYDDVWRAVDALDRELGGSGLEGRAFFPS